MSRRIGDTAEAYQEDWLSESDFCKQSHITHPDIATMVRSYGLEKTNGLGLVFIVDRLVQNAYAPDDLRRRFGGVGAVYVVFSDIATREAISAEREIQRARRSGFRNLWFGAIKRTDENLSKYRKPGTIGRKTSNSLETLLAARLAILSSGKLRRKAFRATYK